MSSTTADRLAKWLVKIGKERAALWALNVKIRGDDPFINMFSKAFLAGGLGDQYASVMLEQFKFRASKANKHLYDFLKDLRNREQLENLFNELKLGPNTRYAIEGLLNIEDKYNLRNTSPQLVNTDTLYRDLDNVRGIGDWLKHFTIYDLIRIYAFKTLKI